MNHIVQKVFQKNIESSMKNLSKKVEKIDGNKKLTAAGKEKAREILFRRYEHRLNDYDRMLTQYGTVDTLAMGARYLELGGKAAVAGMTVQTLFLSGEKLYEYLSMLLWAASKYLTSPYQLSPHRSCCRRWTWRRIFSARRYGTRRTWNNYGHHQSTCPVTNGNP